MAKSNPHRGSNFDDLLKEDGIYEAMQARALKRALAEQLDDAMHAGKLSKVANGVSKTVEIKLKRQFKPRSQTA